MRGMLPEVMERRYGSASTVPGARGTWTLQLVLGPGAEEGS